MSNIKISARPYAYSLPKIKPCLIVIDMQRDFIEPGGFGEALGNSVALLAAIIPKVQNLLSICRKLNIPIVHTRECHKSDLSDCPASKRRRGNAELTIGDEGSMGRILVDGEPGSALVEGLEALPGEYEMTKPGKGAFYATDLHEYLKKKEITHLLFAGVTTEVCVQTSMREANDRGYECLLVEDCTDSYFPAFKRATIEMMVAQGGIVGWVAKSTDVIGALEQAYGSN